MVSIAHKLNGRFKVDASEPGASSQDLESLVAFSEVPIPADYSELAAEMTAVEIRVDDSGYIRIWGPLDCIELNEEYQIQKYLPKSLAIGDDEGGHVYALMEGPSGFGIYKADTGDLDVATAEYVSKSLTDLLVEGIGAENL